jgi:hypothetical protein
LSLDPVKKLSSPRSNTRIVMDRARAAASATGQGTPPGSEIHPLPHDHVEEVKLHVSNEWLSSPQVPRCVYATLSQGLYRVSVVTVNPRGRKDKTLFHGVLHFMSVPDPNVPGAFKRATSGGGSVSEPSSPVEPSSVPRPFEGPAFLRSHHLDKYRAANLTMAYLPASMAIELDSARVASIAIDFTSVADSALSTPGASVVKFTGQTCPVAIPMVALVDGRATVLAQTPTPVSTGSLVARFRSRSIQRTLFEGRQNPTSYLPGPSDALDAAKQHANEEARKTKMFHGVQYEVPREEALRPVEPHGRAPPNAEVETLTYTRQSAVPSVPRAPAFAELDDGRPTAFGSAMAECVRKKKIAKLEWHVVALYGALATLFLWELAVSLKLLVMA